jgi:hypothetical protein
MLLEVPMPVAEAACNGTKKNPGSRNRQVYGINAEEV